VIHAGKTVTVLAGGDNGGTVRPGTAIMPTARSSRYAESPLRHRRISRGSLVPSGNDVLG